VGDRRHQIGKHRVSDNLYLMVRPAKGGGTRASWVFRYETSAGRRRQGRNMGLGSANDFTLAEARDRARRQRQLLADRVDPLQERRARGAGGQAAGPATTTVGPRARH